MMLKHQYEKVRQASLEMVEPLEKEDYIPQAAMFASPPKWNLGHTTWFFEELILSKFRQDYHVFHPQYSYLFNSYYNTVGERVLRFDRGNLSRPTVEEVFDYRRYVDKHMVEFLSNDIPDKQIHELVHLDAAKLTGDVVQHLAQPIVLQDPEQHIATPDPCVAKNELGQTPSFLNRFAEIFGERRRS